MRIGINKVNKIIRYGPRLDNKNAYLCKKTLL